MVEAATSEGASQPRSGVARLFSWSALGRLASGLGRWMMLVLLARVGDPATSELRLGVFVLASSILGPFVPVTRMESRALLSSDAVGKESLRSYFGLRAWSGLVLLALVLFTGAVTVGEAEVVWMLLALALARWIEGLLDVSYGLYEREERPDLVARSELTRALLGIGGAAAVLQVTGSAVGSVFGLAMGWCITLVVLDWRTTRHMATGMRDRRRRSNTSPPAASDDQSTIWTLARRSAPLGIAASLLALTGSLPSYFIEGSADRQTLGIYGAVTYLLAAVALLVTALIGILLPRLGRHLAQGDPRGARRVMLVALGIVTASNACIIVIVAVWGDALLQLVYPHTASGQGELAVWLAVAHAVGATAGIPRALLTAGNLLRAQPIILAFTVVVCGIASWILVPGRPLLGAAQALLIARVVLLVANTTVALRFLRRLERRGASP